MFVINAFCSCILRQCLKYIYTFCSPFYWPLHLFNRWPPGVAVGKVTPFHLPWVHAAQRLYSGCWLFVTVWMIFRSVSVCLHVWVNERVSECVKWACLCVFFWKKKKKKPTQWSYLIWSEFGPTLIGNDRKFACEPSWRWAAESTNYRASTLYVVVRGDELIRYTSSVWVWVYLKAHGGQWV